MTLSTRTKVKPPKELSATYSAVGGFAVTLRWTPVESGAQRSYFVVYRDSFELATGITENSYRDATVLEGEVHVYSVSTVNVNETEGELNAVPELQLPYFPLWESGWSLSLLQGATNDVSARASDPLDTALTFDRDGGTAPSGVTFSSAGVLSIGPTVVVGSYTVGLRATGVSGLAATYALPLTVQSALQAPLDPINLVVGAASSSALNVSWSRAISGDAPADYTVEYSLSASGPWTNKPHSGTATFTLITGLVADTLYYVRVKASNAAGSSGYVSGSGRTNAALGQADFIIPASTTSRTISNATTTAYTGVSWASLATGSKTRPTGGDIIEFAAGTHGKIVVTLNGLASSDKSLDITLRANRSARTTVSAATSFVFTYSNCTYMTIDGGTIGSDYGFLFTAPSASSGVGHFIKCTGMNHHITIRNFEVNGKITSWSGAPAPGVPIGVGLHDNLMLMSAHSGEFQHDILVENFYIHNVAGEGIYGGPNWSTQAVPMKDITIQYGVVEDTGRDGCQIKAAYEGTNVVDHLVCRRVGRNNYDRDAGQLFGVSIACGTARVSNCQVYDSGESGIQFYTQNGPNISQTFYGHGPYTEFAVEAYNNLVVRAGDVGKTMGSTANAGNGIIAGRDAVAGIENCVPPLVNFYNNTAANCFQYGINIGSGCKAGGVVSNNVLIGNGTALNLGVTTTNVGNYITGSPFVSSSRVFDASGDDYHLTLARPVSGTKIASTDLDGDTRTLATADAGAYEYP